MKAEKTTKLIELSIAMNIGNAPYNQKQLHDLCFESDAELTRIEELAAKGLRAEQADREIEAEAMKSRYAKRINGFDYRNGLRFALDRLKGVSSNGR